MAGINWGRVLAGGLVAGIVTFILEGLASQLYIEDMQASLEAHNLSMEMTPTGWVLPLLVSLLGGVVMIFFYAAVRPRFGPGPRTAVIVAFALWLGGYVLSLLGYAVLGLFPASLLTLWGVIGLVELILAALAGGWVYKE